MDGEQLQAQIDLQNAMQQIVGLQQQVAGLQAGAAQNAELHVEQVQQLQAQLANLQARVRPTSAPEKFNASAKQVRDLDMWLRTVQNWLQVQGVTHPHYQILHTVNLFGTVPMTWWNSLAPNAGDMPFNTWDEFVRNLKLAFPNSALEAEARMQLYTMRQRNGQGFMEFLAYFLGVAGRITDLGAAEKYNCLLFAVLPKLREELMRVQPATFEAAVAVCARMAAISGFSRLASSGMGQSKLNGAKHRGGSQGATPMELDALRAGTSRERDKVRGRRGQQKRGYQQPSPPTYGLSPAEIVTHKAEGRCFKCHQKGHRARFCPNGH